VRLATTIEIDEDVKLNEAKTKQLTGGDRITARAMYGHFTEFDPTHKLFLIANHKPHIRSQGMAMWRRIKMIPFRVIIPEHKKDKDLLEKLRAERREFLPGGSGVPKVLSEGLPEPPEWKMPQPSIKLLRTALRSLFKIAAVSNQTLKSKRNHCATGIRVGVRKTEKLNYLGLHSPIACKRKDSPIRRPTPQLCDGLWLLSTKASSKLNV